MPRRNVLKGRGPLATIQEWIKRLKIFQEAIEARTEATIKTKYLPESVQISNLNLEKDDSSLFFAPLPQNRLASVCKATTHNAFPTFKHKREYKTYFELCRAFANCILPTHMYQSLAGLKSFNKIGSADAEKYALAKWYPTSGSFGWNVCDAFTVGKTKPHMILTLVSDCKADNKSLAKSELVTIASFLKITLGLELCKMKKKGRHHQRTHIVCPILIISVFNSLKARVVEAYVDGVPHIQYSKLYDFNKTKHHKPMDLFMRWMISRARGNTQYSAPLPALAESSEDEEDEYSSGDARGD